MIVYLPLLWVRTRRTQIILGTIGMVTDIIRVDLLAWNVLGRWQAHRDGNRAPEKWWMMPTLRPGIRIPGEL